jgi:hypothetical protein
MTDPRPTQNTASPLSEERVREIQYDLATIVGPTGWRWSQCYELTNEIGVTEKHWALTNDESDTRGVVVSGWLVLAATEPRDYDDRPLDENRHLRFIENAPTYLAALLADRSRLSARVEELERELAEVNGRQPR